MDLLILSGFYNFQMSFLCVDIALQPFLVAHESAALQINEWAGLYYRSLSIKGKLYTVIFWALMLLWKRRNKWMESLYCFFYNFTSIVIQLSGKLLMQASSACLGNLCYYRNGACTEPSSWKQQDSVILETEMVIVLNIWFSKKK